MGDIFYGDIFEIQDCHFKLKRFGAIDLYESDLASMVDGGAADGAAATSYGRSILIFFLMWKKNKPCVVAGCTTTSNRKGLCVAQTARCTPLKKETWKRGIKKIGWIELQYHL